MSSPLKEVPSYRPGNAVLEDLNIHSLNKKMHDTENSCNLTLWEWMKTAFHDKLCEYKPVGSKDEQGEENLYLLQAEARADCPTLWNFDYDIKNQIIAE